MKTIFTLLTLISLFTSCTKSSQPIIRNEKYIADSTINACNKLVAKYDSVENASHKESVKEIAALDSIKASQNIK